MAIAVNRPMTTLVAMTALPPLMAFGAGSNARPSGVQDPTRTPPLVSSAKQRSVSRVIG
jgi:hypothetical protein